MIQSVNTRIKEVKPFVDFGISPFGIWKSGVPQGSSGMSAYSTIYADALAWLEGGYIDYLVPQLYWRIEFYPLGTDFNLLSDWWSEQVGDIHLYTGHGLYRADGNTFSSTPLFSADEIPKQIRRTRSNANILGNVFFRAKNISQFNSKGIKDSLIQNYYKYPALTPSMSWKSQEKPETPQNLTVTALGATNDERTFKLDWSKSAPMSATDSLITYAVYRVTSDVEPDPSVAMNESGNLIHITTKTTFEDKKPGIGSPNWYFITAFNRNSIESLPTAVIETEVITSLDESHINQPHEIALEQNYPNPFNPETQIRFTLNQPQNVSLTVFNVLGQPVEMLINQKNMNSGAHTVTFKAGNLPSGMYFYQLRAGAVTLTQKMMLLK
jgi:hypothetical protein